MLPIYFCFNIRYLNNVKLGSKLVCVLYREKYLHMHVHRYEKLMHSLCTSTVFTFILQVSPATKIQKNNIYYDKESVAFSKHQLHLIKP